MKQLVFAIFFSTLLVSCTQNDRQTQILDFGTFTIETPKGWKKIHQRSIDSQVGCIAIDTKDTLYFDLGWYSNDLNEFGEIDIDGKKFYIDPSVNGHHARIYDSSAKEELIKSDVSWTKIDNLNAKILSPIKSGIGTTGIYIDSLWERGADVDKFNLYGRNLSPKNERDALAAFKTLKFRREK